MTALAVRLPLAAGGAVLEATGNAIHWGVARYMRAPLANTGLLALVTMTAFAASNALYLQPGDHPAPLFALVGTDAPVVEQAPIPAPRPKMLRLSLPKAADETAVTGSVRAGADAVPATDRPLDNADVLEIQRKLALLQLYDGALDGLYGSRTANAIREFESRTGLTPRGELTRTAFEAIRNAPAALPATPEPEVLPLAAMPAPAVAQPEPIAAQAVSAIAQASPAPSSATTRETTFRPSVDTPRIEIDLEPLPAPAPLEIVAPATPEVVAPATLQVVAPATPEPIVESTAETVEAIITGVQQVPMTRRGTAAVPASRQAALPQQQTAQPVPELVVTGSIGTAPAAAVVEPQGPEPELPVLDTGATREELKPFSATDPDIVATVQRGLASLGFLHGTPDGVAGEATAKAIRHFEVYFNYGVTGRITPGLLDLLVRHGAAL